MRARFFITTPNSAKSVAREIYNRALLALESGSTVTVTYRDSDGPSDKMRARFNAMCRDVATKFPQWRGADMSGDDWKAVFICAHVGQSWVPGLDGKPVPVRYSSEDFTLADYSALIDIARDWGDSHGVEWTVDPMPPEAPR